ncbi:MAG TPA: acylphosphatase [Candidatus Kapabacteria bacterium]|nr:acylphosphatase [Candidatus Kapabacteria bacterium]
MALQRFRLKFIGLVQGVGFRQYTYRIARQFGATGFVVNNIDGSVSAEIQLNSKLVHNLLAELKRGPSHSIVCEFTKTEINLLDNDNEFKIIR